MAEINSDKCEKIFATARSLSNPKTTHNQSNKVTCELCGKQFRSDNFKRHKESCKIKSLDSDKSIYKCDICRMEFDAKNKLNQHFEVHTEKLSCNLCEKNIRPRSMNRHIKLAHTITQDNGNFLRVLSKKRDIKCKL